MLYFGYKYAFVRSFLINNKQITSRSKNKKRKCMINKSIFYYKIQINLKIID